MDVLFEEMAVTVITKLKERFPKNTVIHNTYRHSVGSKNTRVVAAFKMCRSLNPNDHSPGVELFRKFMRVMNVAMAE